MAQTEGPKLHPQWKLLQSPRAFISPFVASAPTLGVAIGAVDAFTTLARDARRRFNRIAESDAVQLKLSESAAEVDAGRLMIEYDCLEMMKHVDAGTPVPAALRVRTRRDSAYVGLLAHRAVDRLHTAIGSRGVFDGHPLERALRDVHTGIAQVGLHWEISGTPYAQYIIEGTMDGGVQLNQ
jgi:3-hydroxy-9,10-secoandrosta-1,3,5(10)-triene-9,17-dione monooxygenase